MGHKFAMNVSDLDIEMADPINPSREPCSTLLKCLDAGSLRKIAAVVLSKQSSITSVDAWPISRRLAELKRLTIRTEADFPALYFAEGAEVFMPLTGASRYDRYGS